MELTINLAWIAVALYIFNTVKGSIVKRFDNILNIEYKELKITLAKQEEEIETLVLFSMGEGQYELLKSIYLTDRLQVENVKAVKEDIDYFQKRGFLHYITKDIEEYFEGETLKTSELALSDTGENYITLRDKYE